MRLDQIWDEIRLNMRSNDEIWLYEIRLHDEIWCRLYEMRYLRWDDIWYEIIYHYETRLLHQIWNQIIWDQIMRLDYMRFLSPNYMRSLIQSDMRWYQIWDGIYRFSFPLNSSQRSPFCLPQPKQNHLGDAGYLGSMHARGVIGARDIRVVHYFMPRFDIDLTLWPNDIF